jgi:F-type H+-transporting ATPase subunit alpha
VIKYVNKATKKTLAKGARLVELLKQGLYAPVPVERQVVSVFVGTNDFLESIPVEDIKRFEKEFLEFVELKFNDIYESIRVEKEINKDTAEKIKKAVDEFLPRFKKSV